MASVINLCPAQHSDFCRGDGLIQDPLPIVKKGMLKGRAEDPNNVVILVGPTEEKFVVNACLAKLSSRRLEKSIKKASESNEILKFPDIDPKHFQTVLECAIVGMKWTITNLKETCRLIEIAALFGFYVFIEIICESVFQQAQTRDDLFDEKESLEIIVFQSLRVESVRQIALDYILEHASSIFPGNNFLQLSPEDLGEILIQDKLKIESEVEVLNALIRWGINALKNECKLASPGNLRDALAEPLNWIRFPNMDRREFQDYVIPLQILTDRQISSMDYWYNNGGSFSAFNNHPRNYLKAQDAKPARNDSKSMEEFRHATKMNHLIAKFTMNIQLHNVETEAGNSKILARSLATKNLALENTVQRMESLVEKLEKIIEANKFFQNLEALKKYYDNRQIETFRNQKKEIDYNLLELVADKIRKNEDFSELAAKIEKPGSIDLLLMESNIETIEKKVVELRKVKCSEVYESLAWKICQNETNSTVLALQKFPNINTFKCAIIFKNNTSETLTNFQNDNLNQHVYRTLPSNIMPFCKHNYGQTSSFYTAGVLSYDIGSIRIIIRHCLSSSENDFGIAFAPLTFPMINSDGFSAFTKQDWTNDSTKIKALCQAPEVMEKCIKLGNLCLHAELIGTGPKAVLRVLLTSL